MSDDTSRLVEQATDALVRSMADDEAPRWQVTLEGYSGLFAKASHVAAELQRSRAEVAARPDLAPEAAGEWRPKLRRLLEADPGTAERLRELLREPEADVRVREGTANTLVGDVSGVAVQLRDVHGNIGETTRGDRIDQSGATAGRDVIGVQYNDGRDR